MSDLKKFKKTLDGIGRKWHGKALCRDEPSKIGNLWKKESFPFFSIKK